MAKRSFMIKDALLDPYERKILNKRTDDHTSLQVVLVVENL